VRTPSGVECSYFYGDYFRGKNREECRLLGPDWRPELCRTCPVPGILRANGCPHMQISARVEKKFLGLKKQVKVTAFCRHSQQNVAEPHIGCGQCHTLPPFSIEK